MQFIKQSNISIDKKLSQYSNFHAHLFNTFIQFFHAFNSIPTQIGTGLFHLFLTQVACLYPTNSNPELQVNLAIRPRDLILTRPFFSEFLIDGHRARISIKWIELLHLKKHYNQIKIPKILLKSKWFFAVILYSKV